MARWDEPAGLFYIASQSTAQLALAAVITGPPIKTRHKTGLPARSAALAALFRVLVLVLLTWLLAGVLTLLALSRILVLLARLFGRGSGLAGRRPGRPD